MKHFVTELAGLLQEIVGDTATFDTLLSIHGTLVARFFAGSKVLLAGNGGSAADAQHFAAELVGRYKRERRGYPAIALSTDTSVLTAIGNDYSFNEIFSRQVDALGKKGDIFIGFSTSGNSENIIKAIKKAQEKELTTMAFLGKGGGATKGLSDYEVIVPSDNTPRIQEVHGLMIHMLCEELDKAL